MIPCLASIEGYRSSEIAVTHHARQHGVSKYGFKRFARGFFDMVTVYFLKNYKDRPMHLFGGLASAVAATGIATAAFGFIQLLLDSASGMGLLSVSLAAAASAIVLAAIGLTNELAISGKGGELHTPILTETTIAMSLKTDKIPTRFSPRTAVLVVDDPEHRESYANHLEDAHYKTHYADGWSDAFQLARRFDATIFTDKSQGHLHHDPRLKKAFKRAPNTKLVFCSDKTEELYFGEQPNKPQETTKKFIPFPSGNSAA